MLASKQQDKLSLIVVARLALVLVTGDTCRLANAPLGGSFGDLNCPGIVAKTL